MSKKEPMSIALKAKLLIQGEYLLIGLIFLVVGILKLTGVFPTNGYVRFRIFNFVTLLGSAWIMFDFLWSTFSKARRAKVDYIDKILVLPAGLAFYTFDLICLVRWNEGILPYSAIVMGSVFCYIACVYIFQAIYHWFKPTKALLAAIAEDEKTAEERKLEAEKAVEENVEKENNDA